MIDCWREANRAFYLSKVWTTVKIDGYRTLKYPTDLYVFTEIIEATRPDVIVETGSLDGGSAAWFSRFADVISVDIRSPGAGIPRVTWVQGDSVEVAPQVAEMVGDRRCLVTLDSAHDSAHVIAELDAYEPIASDYLVVEDTAVDVYDLDDYPQGGPGRAVDAWLIGHPEWESDARCERFMLGMNPGGWLRRT